MIVGIDVGFDDVGFIVGLDMTWEDSVVIDDVGFEDTVGCGGTPAQSLATLISAQFQN